MEHRAQFFGLAAKIMRDILVDNARKRVSAKRGGQQIRLSLDEVDRIGRKPEVEDQFLKAHSLPAPSVERDQEKKETVVRANGEILVHVIKLEHH